MDYKKLADMLFPNVKDRSFYENKYKKRNLKPGQYVTRFAPSPTGYVHIGHMLQSILDYSLAKQTGGTFILRIEDTDEKRFVSDAVEVLFKTLNYYNIKPDEGLVSPTTQVGDYGPYIQSERKEIYQSYAKYLVEQGLAYPCFCTEEDDDKMRAAQKKEMGEYALTGYYGKWRKCHNLTLEQVAENLKNKKPFTIRFKSQSNDLNEKIEGEDAVRGTLSMQRWFKDEIILKSNGQSLYHLAHMVDDYLMGVNLVVRGSEWLPTYPLHLELLNALKFPKPKYMHTLLLCKVENGSKVKLSKRKHPECNMAFYEQEGYVQEAVIDYLFTMLDPNFENWRKLNPTASALDFKLNIKKFNPSEAMLDVVKINDISKNVIAYFSAEELYNRLLIYTQKFDKEFYKQLSANKDYAIKFLSIDRGGEKPRKDIAKLSEVKDRYAYFYKAPQVDFAKLELRPQLIKTVLSEYLKIYNEADDKDTWWNKIKALAEKLNFATDNKQYRADPSKFEGNISTLSNIIRVALTNSLTSVDMYYILKTLGTKEVTTRFNNLIKSL